MQKGTVLLFPFVKMIENPGGVLTHLKSWSVETLVTRPAGATSSWRLAQHGVEPALFQREVH